MGVRPIDVPPYVEDICLRLNSLGFSAYVVGGALRDTLIGRPVDDWDVATSATPEVVESIFALTVPTGIRHGTVTVLHGPHHVEVTTFRREGRYEDGRHPDYVQFIGDIQGDLARRDFTINAMAYDPLSGQFVDPFDGKKDMRNGIVRAVGDPGIRFTEDRLRMLRAVRLATILGFTIEPETFDAICRRSSMITSVSPERIRDELLKMIVAEKPSLGLRLLRETGLLHGIIPELLEGYGVEQNRHHIYDVYEHNVRTMDAIRNDPDLRLAALLHDVGKPRVKDGEHFYGHERVGATMARRILERLRLPKKRVNRIVHLIDQHMFRYETHWSGSAVRRFIKRVGIENIDDILELRVADRKGSGREEDPSLEELRRRIEATLKEGVFLTVGDLAVNGDDVRNVAGGSIPGKAIGAILSQLLNEVIDDPKKNDRAALLQRIREILADR